MAFLDADIGGLPEGVDRVRLRRRSSEGDLERLARSMQSSVVKGSFAS